MPSSAPSRPPARLPGRWLPLWLMGLGIAITLAVAAALMDHLLHLRQDHETMAVHELQAAHLAERILTLDEVLSASALLAASTGEPRWQARHAAHAEELTATLRAAITLAPEAQAMAAARETEQANDLRLELETRAFAAVAAGQLEQARELLESPGYRAAKDSYAWGMQRFAQALRERAEAALTQVDGHMASCVRVTAVGLGGLGLVWVSLCALAVRQLRRTRRMRDHLGRCRADLATANRQRTRSLEETGASLGEPLRRVLSETLALRGGNLTALQAGHVDAVEQAAHGALDLLTDVVDLARLEERRLPLSAEPVDPAECVRTAVDAWRAAASERGVALRAFVGIDCPALVRTDGRRLTQVLLQLVDRAVQVTEQGAISVHVNGRSVAEGRCRLRVTVRDTGPGLDERQRERLFVPHRELLLGAHEHRPGSLALRLAISHRLVTLMGGSLTVESAPGEGTALWLDLHCEQLQAPRPSTQGADGLQPLEVGAPRLGPAPDRLPRARPRPAPAPPRQPVSGAA